MSYDFLSLASHGLFDLPWWGYVVFTLVVTHVTIAAVTIFLHRSQAHRGLDLHPAVSHFFRFWLWLTTGMVTKEWVAIHRKHHAKCETAEDPHSPQVLGINRVLFTGVALYVKESHVPDTMQRYGHGTPDDWIERRIYTPHHKKGILVMLLVNVTLFGAVPGLLMWGIQMAWIPFWAAGVINGIGHFWGYRKFQTEDASTNIVPIAAWIGGEELHNNHHAFPTSAKFSVQWYEFDLGWAYIRTLSALGLAQVRRVAPKLRLEPSKPEADHATLQAVITHRYHVATSYARSLKAACGSELESLRQRVRGIELPTAARLKRWLADPDALPKVERERLAHLAAHSKTIAKIVAMRAELSALWSRSTESSEQLLARLQDWCRRAEASGIAPLAQFSLQLKRYA